MEKVKRIMIGTRAAGTALSRRFVMANNPILLKENGGSLQLTEDWEIQELGWIGLDWNALFCVNKIIEKNHMHKMHSSSSYQSICLIKVNIKNNNNNNNNDNNNNNNNNNK